MDYYYNQQWRHLLDSDVTDGMRRYAARIHEAAREQPELLVAHSYTRYLGDMSGGQILRRLIKKRYSLPEGAGVSFYSFDHVHSIAAFKDLYTSRMNGLELSEQEIDDQVEEASRIFQLNIDVFEEVGAKFKPTSSTVTTTAVTNGTSQTGTDISNGTLASPRFTSSVAEKSAAALVGDSGDYVSGGGGVAHSLATRSLITVASLLVGLSATAVVFCPWIHSGDL